MFCTVYSILSKNNERILSPYNSIPGYEREDWTKSPDFGILKFKSNVKENLKFDRIEPSENVNEFKGIGVLLHCHMVCMQLSFHRTINFYLKLIR